MLDNISLVLALFDFEIKTEIIRDSFVVVFVHGNWSRKLAPLSQLFRCKTKPNCDLVAVRVFPRFRQFVCFHFQLSLAPRDFYLG